MLEYASMARDYPSKIAGRPKKRFVTGIRE